MRPTRIHLAIALLFCTAVMPAGCSHAAAPTTAETLTRSLRLLDAIDADPKNTIPDGVLNAAHCLLIIPAGLSRASLTCRDFVGNWQAPEVLESAVEKQARLLLVMSPRAQKAIVSGTQQPHWTVLPGPLTRDTPLASDGELKADLLAYTWDGKRFAGATLDDIPGSTVVADPGSLLIASYLAAVNSFANTILPTGVVLHHTGVVPSETPSERAVDEFHRERGFTVTCFGREYHVAYHFLIQPDGTVQPGRPERCQGAHARGYNSYLGIALVGDFSRRDNPDGQRGLTRPTPQQMDALLQLCRELRDRYHIPLQHFLRHSDIAATHCPGDRLEFRKLMRALEQP